MDRALKSVHQVSANRSQVLLITLLATGPWTAYANILDPVTQFLTD